MKHSPRSVDLWNLILVAALALMASAAHGQEPRTQIKPADPVSAASHDVTVMGSDYSDKPIVQPTPLPPLKVSLGEYARRVRAAHQAAPKAVKFVDTDSFVVEEASATEPIQ